MIRKTNVVPGAPSSGVTRICINRARAHKYGDRRGRAGTEMGGEADGATAAVDIALLLCGRTRIDDSPTNAPRPRWRWIILYAIITIILVTITTDIV